MKDDFVIVSSDGLFDNLDHKEIELICQKVEKIIYISFFSTPYRSKPCIVLKLNFIFNKKSFWVNTVLRFVAV